VRTSARNRPPVPGWLTGRADTGGLPALLGRLAHELSVTTIDEVWMFPTRRLSGFESTVIVLSLYADEHDRRHVVTAHFKAMRNKRGEATIEMALEDHAVAPADRLIRVIDGVLRRLGDDLAATPQAARISGEEERYQALIEASASGIDLEEALERVRERPGGGAVAGADTDVSTETGELDED
jgi:hypothetical protein